MVGLVAAVLVVVLPEMLYPTPGALLYPARVSGAPVCVWDLLSTCLAQQLLSSGGCKQMLWEGGREWASKGGRGLHSPCRGERTSTGASHPSLPKLWNWTCRPCKEADVDPGFRSPAQEDLYWLDLSSS